MYMSKYEVLSVVSVVTPHCACASGVEQWFVSIYIIYIYTSKCGLQPHLLLSARSAVKMYVTMDSAIGSLLPRFRG